MVDIVTNTLRNEAREAVEASVRAAIALRPGLWQVTLLGSHRVERFVVFIRHPEAGFNRSWVFGSLQDPVQRTIEDGLAEAGIDRSFDYPA